MILLAGSSGLAQDGKLDLHVTPKQAYIFVDGRAISEASKHHVLTGDHKIELVNYGYQPANRTVTITASHTGSGWFNRLGAVWSHDN
jgi:archaellum component FlaF (FlaF/FlaG flagellin family)